MGVTIEIGLPGQAKADALAVPVGRPPHGLGGEGGRIVDEKLDGGLTRLLASGELRGDTGEALVLHVEGLARVGKIDKHIADPLESRGNALKLGQNVGNRF